MVWDQLRRLKQQLTGSHRGQPPVVALGAFEVQQALLGPSVNMIFDVGAHVGGIALKYRQLFPKAHVHAFEPFPDSFAQATAACAHDSAIQVHQLAVSDHVGEQVFHSNAYAPTNSILPSQAQAGQIWGEGKLETQREFRVASTTLDRFCEARGITALDVLKMDIQGAEYLALLGARQLLERRSIGLLYTEIILANTYQGQQPLHAYLSLLDGFGYELVDFFHPARAGHKLVQMDAVFVPRR